jgi:Helix-turn-helix domain
MENQPREIPAELARQLEEEICRALAHPCRRQILRALTAEDQGMSTVQLDPLTGASYSLSCTSYHARRLEEAELIAQVGSEGAEGTLTHCYSSLIGGNGLLLAVLEATEASDQNHPAPRRPK